VNPFTPALVELLLRYGVDPNLEYNVKKPTSDSDKAKEASDKAGDKKAEAATAQSKVDTPGCLPKYYLDSMESAQKLKAEAERSARSEEKKTASASEEKGTNSGATPSQPSRSDKPSSIQKANLEKPLSLKTDSGASAGKKEQPLRKPSSIAKARRLKSCSSGLHATKASQQSASLASISSHMIPQESLGESRGLKPLARYSSMKLLDSRPKESGPALKPIKRTVAKSAKVRKHPRRVYATGEDSGMDTGREDMDASVRAAVAKEIASWEEEKIMAGENEGSTSLTAIHFLCSSKLYGKAIEKEKVCARFKRCNSLTFAIVIYVLGSHYVCVTGLCF